MTDALLDSLRAAVAANPADVALRLHFAELLIDAGRPAEAVEHVSAVLAVAPADPQARALMLAALSPGAAAPSVPIAPAGNPAPGSLTPDNGDTPPRADGPASTADARETGDQFDWTSAEAEVESIAPRMFADGEPSGPSAFDLERSTITLADVGGMAEVKERLNAAFLAPLKNPELRALYGKSLRGGLLMYGPPGCGKTYLARAVAGELGAAFLTVGISDILDQYIGQSEGNIHELFQLARRSAPCVVFLDELDAIGQRRSLTRGSVLRGVVVALLEELDGVGADNEGVFVLAATNQPWDVDPALRRPGRFDRTVLVLPPDEGAREAIFRHHLAGRPIAGIDTAALARSTDGYSGADIAYVCEVASERALIASVSAGAPRMIDMGDLTDALGQVRPSTGSWLESVRTIVNFGDDDGTFGQLRAYLKKSKRL